MNLLVTDFDRKATKKNVQQLLNTYRTLIRIAGENEVPKMTSNCLFELAETNQDFDFFVTKNDSFNRSLLAKNELLKIREGFNRIDKHNRQILYDKYINKEISTNISIFMNYHISESTFYRDLEKACICFAEAYNKGELLVEK